MTDEPENPRAFPKFDDNILTSQRGMTLRDYFAGQAMAGMLASPSVNSKAGVLAGACYEQADNMLKERTK